MTTFSDTLICGNQHGDGSLSLVEFASQRCCSLVKIPGTSRQVQQTQQTAWDEEEKEQLRRHWPQRGMLIQWIRDAFPPVSRFHGAVFS